MRSTITTPGIEDMHEISAGGGRWLYIVVAGFSSQFYAMNGVQCEAQKNL